MRLAVVSPFVDRSHGTERALAELLERLAYTYQCEIHLFSQRVEGVRLSTRASLQPSSCGCIIWHRVPAIPGPHLIGFISWLMLNATARMRHGILRRRSFDLLLSPGINSLHADFIVVHALFDRLQQLSYRAAGDRGMPTSMIRKLHRRLYYRLLAALEHRLYRDPKTALVAVSQRTASLLAQTYGRAEVPVVRNGVDTSQFSPSTRLARRTFARTARHLMDSHFLLLLIGNDWQTKGALTVMKAMADCGDLALRFLIVGDDDPRPLHEHAHQLGVHSRCFLERSRHDVMDFYAACDIYVCPSREDSFGLPVLEAMACGLPVITSKFAGVAELISNGNDGFVVDDPNDSTALAHLLRRICTDEALRKSCSEAAVLTAQRWSWDRNAAEMWQLLRARVALKSAGHSTAK